MTASINDTLAHVPELNSPDNSFVYTVEGNQIVGKWDITNSRWFAPTAITDKEQKYEVRVTLNNDGTYAFNETKDESSWSFGLSGLKYEKSTFKGKRVQKTFDLGVGGEKDGSNGIGVNSFSFDTKKIKEPLLSYLDNNGWKKKGFLAGLFSN